MKKLLVLLSLLFIFTLTPSVFAQTTDTNLPSPGILPDSPIYFLKPLSEKVRGLFIFGEDNKALYALTLVDKRLSEAKALSDKGKDNLAGNIIEQAGKENENAQEHLAKAETGGKDVTAVVERLVTNSARQQAVLAKVLEKVPEQAKAAIRRTMEMSKRGLTKAQEMQTKEKGKPENRGKSEDGGQPGRTSKSEGTETSNGIPGKPNGNDRQRPGGQDGPEGRGPEGPGEQGQDGPGGGKGPGPGGQGQGGPGQGGPGGGKGPGGKGPGGGEKGNRGPGPGGQGQGGRGGGGR